MSWLNAPPTAVAESDVTQQLPVIEADTLESRCLHYRRDCGLEAWVQPVPGRIMLAADRIVTTVTMRAELGARVRNRMRESGVRVGPISSYSRAKQWSFLVRPDIPDDNALHARLFRLYVAVARPGAQIALPAPTHRHLRSWVEVPVDDYRPSGLAVIAAVTACTQPIQHRRLAAG